MLIADLFSGAGGLTFGFYYKINRNRFIRNTENNIIFANEYAPQAALAFSKNFPKIPLIQDDITNITTKCLHERNINIDNIDLVIGGPPCQSYSTVGKRQYDQRAKMYQEYIRVLGILKPKLFIYENVTGLLTMKNNDNKPVIDDIKHMFANVSDIGYSIHQKVLNAKEYGVPQSRERLFIVGIRKDLDPKVWGFPVTTYGFEERPYLAISDAISDLPPLHEGEEVRDYTILPQNRYQELMRHGSYELRDHLIGTYNEKIRTVIENISQGEGKEQFNNLVKAGKISNKFFLTSGYHNTYGRLWWDKPATTITNSFATPSALRCIHPLQNRALSTREGARLQSFPDWFRFFGNKYEKNSQVGNAVPPLLAIELAKSVKRCLEHWEG